MEIYGRRYAEAQSRQIPRKILELVDTYLPISSHDRVVEYGAGNGNLLQHLLQKTKRAAGIDINNLAGNKNLPQNYLHADATLQPLRDDSIDKTVSVHTFEHIEEVGKVFAEIERVTRPGGLSLHVFPAHLFTKAEGALQDAWRMGIRNPYRLWQTAHEIHKHRLSPQKIAQLIEGTNLRMILSRRVFIPQTFSRNYVVLLHKDTSQK